MGLVKGGNTPSLTVGGRVFTDLTNLKILKTYNNANAIATARAPNNANAGYTPSGTKAFRVLAFEFQCISNTATAPTLHYSDNDVGFNSSTALTNPVYEHNAGVNDYAGISDLDQVGVNVRQVMQTNFLVPNGKYVGVAGAAGCLGWIYGYEE